MPELLFVYGTLQDPDIQKKIVGRQFDGEPDILEHYTISQNTLIDGIYPILDEAINKNVKGIVLNVLITDLPVLDEYEGNEYKRVKVLLRSGKEAWVYK